MKYVCIKRNVVWYYCSELTVKWLDQISVSFYKVLWFSSIYNIDSGHLGSADIDPYWLSVQIVMGLVKRR